MTPAARRFILENRVFRPTMLPGLAAWYDVSDVSSLRNNAGAIPASGDGIKLVSDKSGNSLVNCLCLNGASGNYASAPDSNALDTTGDIDIRVLAAADNWLPATLTTLLDKYGGAGQRSWRLSLNSGATGRLVFQYTSGGTTGISAISTASPSVSNYSSIWIRVTRATASGDVVFYTSTDGSNWVQLGTTVTTAASAIFASTTALNIGANTAGTGSVWLGRIYRAQIRNNILDNGTGIQFDANFATASKLATSFTESSANAATVTINTSGATGARICGARDLYQGTAANQPVYLPWVGSNYGYLNGAVGTYFSAPDSVPLSITGDIDIAVRMSLASWSAPASTQRIITKRGSASTISYDLSTTITTGFLQFITTADGSTARTFSSTTAPGFAAGATGWIRVTRNSTTGTVTFYTAADQPGVPASWTQLGSAGTPAAGDIYDGATALEIGITNAGTAAPMTGSVYRALIYNTIGGSTPAFDFNPSAYVSGTTFLDSSSNAATITLNGGATIVTRSCLYGDGSDDYMKSAAFSLAQPETVYFVGKQVSWTLDDSLFAGNVNGACVVGQNPTTPNVNIYAGSSVATVSWSLQTPGVLSSLFNGALSTNRLNRGAAATGDPGGTAPNGFTLFANGNGGTGYANATASEILIYAAAHNTATQNRVILWLARKFGIAA